MKDGAAGWLASRHGQCLRSTSPVPAEWSVFYKAIQRTQRRERATSRGSPLHLSLPGYRVLEST